MACKEAVAALMLSLLVISPLSVAIPALEGGETSGSSAPMATSKLPRMFSPWYEYFADPSQTETVNASYNMRTQPGSWYVMRYSQGWLLSIPYTINEGKRWDYAAVMPMQGNPSQGSTTLTALDPDGTPSTGYPGEVLVQTTALLTSPVSIDLRSVDPDTHVRVQLHILLNDTTGFSNLGFTGWTLGVVDEDCWRDPFLDIGRDYSRGDLSLGDGEVYPVSEWVAGGLKGSYFDNRDFTAWRYDQIDPVVDFNWGNNGPTGLGSNTFSIRWTGKINIVRNDRYTFFLRIDDGGRLWIDDVQLIDKWFDQGATEYWAQAILAPGLHDVKVEYYENQGGASCEFRWASSTIAKQIVPQSALWGKEAVNTLVSERIQCPLGSTWELLLVDEDKRPYEDREVRIDVLDESTGKPVPGFQDILTWAADLSGVPASLYPSIQLRARWVDIDIHRPPVLEGWAIKWRPDRTWRTEFLSDVGIRGMVGFDRYQGFVMGGWNPQVAFAEATNGISNTVPSHVYNVNPVYRMSKYVATLVDDIITTNASDVAMADLDRDGVLDVLYTFSSNGSDAVSYAGYTAGLRDIPQYTFSHTAGAGKASDFTSIKVDDIDSDGVVEVILAERTQAGKGRLLVYEWNGTGFPSTPDRTIGDLDGTIADVARADFDDDGRDDLALAISEGPDEGLLVLWGTASGHSVSVSRRLLSRSAYALAIDEFIDHEWPDLVVACEGNETRRLADIINCSNIIFSSGTGRSAIGPWLAIAGPPAIAATIVHDDSTDDPRVVLVQNGTVNVYNRPYRMGPNITLGKGVTDVASVVWSDFGLDTYIYSVAERADVPELSNYSLVESEGHATDGAMALAAGEMLGPNTAGLRTDKINIGDPRYYGGWEALRYRLYGDAYPGQNVTFRLLDGETELPLWNATSNASEMSYDLTGIIRIKEHPSVIIEVLVHNTNLDWALNLDDIQINWTLRTPAPPTVLTLTADDPVIYRTNATRVRLTVDDEYDNPRDLAPLVQMRSPGALGWTPIGFGAAVWDGMSFVIDFKTTRDHPTGNYSFRARVTDSDSMDSTWFQADGLVRVLNNPPGIPTISLTPDPPGTAADIRVAVLEQASDRDTSYLSYLFEWSRDGTPVTEVTTDTVPAALTTRGETWSVIVRAFDGEDKGPAVSASVTVVNTPPAVTRPLAPVLLDEDHEPVTVQLRSHFSDADGDPIAFTVVGFYKVQAPIDPATSVLTIVFPTDWWGMEEGTVTASDGSLTATALLEVDIRGIPDAPVIVSIGGALPINGTFHITARQDVPMAFLVAVGDPDSVRFTFRTDAELGWLSVAGDNGTIDTRATNAEVGTLWLNLSVQDDSGQSVVVRVELTVENVNDPPGIVYVLQPKNGKVFQANDSILLQGYCADPDEPFGDVLTYTWYTNASSTPLGTGTALTIPRLEPGDHNITLEVSDGQYIKRSWVRISVLPPVRPPPDDHDGDGDGDDAGPRTMATAGPIILALVLVLLVIVGAIAFVTRQRAVRGMGQPARPRQSPPTQASAAKAREPDVHGAPLIGERTGITIEKPRDMRSIMTEPSVSQMLREGSPAPAGWELKRGPPPPPAEKPTFDGWEEID